MAFGEVSDLQHQQIVNGFRPTQGLSFGPLEQPVRNELLLR
jgi:hypothetical protein